MNPAIQQLHTYPFAKLNALFGELSPPDTLAPVNLSIGEPQHPAPEFVRNMVASHTDQLARYPTTAGIPELRETIATWLKHRFHLSQIFAEQQVLPVTGTREALFAFVQAAIDPSKAARVLMPNPFYQIYEGAALLAGATPEYLSCTAETAFKPDFASVSEKQWQDCQLLFICSPGNPTGAVLSLEEMQQLIRLADTHDFIIASDECYSEIWFEQQPPGLLEACAAMGRHDYSRCVVFHSLSKRSNLPGMRSGFCAGDARLLQPFLLYRTYHGCAMPLHHQLASIAAWQDEQHVEDNRQQYRNKFSAVLDILGNTMTVSQPDAGFYLWAATPQDDQTFARALKSHCNITVLPGSFLSREVNGINPGSGYVRMALVASLEDCVTAAKRIEQFVREY